MRLKLLLTVFALGLTTLMVSAQSTVTIGTGTTLNRFPLGHLWGFERSVALYTAAEIGQAGAIDRIAWNASATGTVNRPVVIYMAHTAATTLTSSTFATYSSTATMVYSGSPGAPTAGWNNFDLASSFSYNGTQNLLVIVESNHGGFGAGGSVNLNHTAATSRHQTWNADNAPPTTTGTIATSRPNVQIRFAPPQPDLSVSALLSPVLAACNSTAYNLRFRIRNGGTVAINSGNYVRYGYYVNNGTPVLDSVLLTSNLAGNGTIDVFFNGVNFNTTGNFNFRVWAGSNVDGNRTNDSSSYTVENPNCLSSNYFNNFEADNGGWTSSGVWAWGVINKGLLNNPPSGTRGWITDLVNQYPNNANASLASPFLNFSNSCVPSISWAMRFETEAGWDGMILEASTDNLNWTKITTITPAYNNTSTFGPIAPPKYSGTNTAWTNYTADLSAYAGQPVVRLRFRFGSDGSGQRDGVAIDNVTMILESAYTGANFSLPDTAFTNVLLEQEIMNLGPQQTGIVFRWFINGNQVGTNYDLDHRFTSAGTYQVKLRAQDNCGLGLDSITKTIVIIDPILPPTADFIADKNVVGTFQPVFFTNLSENGAATYEWYVSPATVLDPITQVPLPSVSFDNATNSTSKNPVMSFFGNGIYEVCLISENILGRDTTCKSAYIAVGGASGSGADSLMCSGTSTSAASGRIHDSGGPNGNYRDSENCTFTIDFPCYDSLYLNMTFFNVEANWDFFFIYDGDLNGTPLWNQSAYPNGLTGLITNPAINPATSGKVTIRFQSDGIINNPGFTLEYQAASPKILPTVANFVVPDTICATYSVQFTNTSTNANEFLWDFLGQGSFMSTAKNPQYTYANDDTYPVRLIVKGCSGSDTIVKNVVVVAPGAVSVNFGSQHTVYNTSDIVTLFDSTDGCTDQYLWRIDPPYHSYVNSNNASKNISVRFDSVGTYSVTLKVFNNAGEDSLVRSNYITVVEKCSPTIANNNSDLGISRVVLNTINNSTPANQGYTDYSSISTRLEKGFSYTVTVQRPTIANNLNRKVWIDWNADGDFDDLGEEVLSESSAKTLSASATFTVPLTAANGLVNMRVSTSYQTQANTPCGARAYGETEDYRLILIPDVIAPVITLLGNDTVTINRMDNYIDAGATAFDNLDGDITGNIIVTNNVDINNAGSYTVFYNVSDNSGNMAEPKMRTVIVLPDGPSIVLNGNALDTIEVFDTYVDLGANGQDYMGNLLTEVRTGSINSSLVGRYILTYTVTDMNGRTASTTREVQVLDRTAPTATLIGADTLSVEVFGTFNDPGVTPADNYCAVSTITVSASTLDLTVTGYQTLDYTVTDCQGNSSMISRVVNVIDTEAPVIRLVGSLSANVTRPRTYTDEGYSVSDNYDKVSDITVTTITNLVDTETPGLFTLRYRATDASGNSSESELRFIFVMDNVGIENMIQSSLNVYPNPNRGAFTVEHQDFVGQTVDLRIIDVTGRLINNEKLDNFSGSRTIDLVGRGSGVYMVFLTVGNQQAVARVIIQ